MELGFFSSVISMKHDIIATKRTLRRSDGQSVFVYLGSYLISHVSKSQNFDPWTLLAAGCIGGNIWIMLLERVCLRTHESYFMAIRDLS